MLRRCAGLVSRRPWLSSGTRGRRVSSQILDQQQRDIDELNDFFPAIVGAVEEAVQPLRVPTSELKWLIKALDYNNRTVRWPGTLSTLNTMRVLSGQPANETDPELMHKAMFLAWCHELTIGAYNIADDLVDGGEMRWDKPCWYKLPDVGLACVNDAFLLEKTVYYILQQQFKGEPCYIELVELFWHTTFLVMMGQNYDSRCLSNGRAVMDDFVLERYEDVVRLKTTEATFYSPVAAAMLASGVKDSKAYNIARDISGDLGILIQSQDDYNDCFGRDEMDQRCNDIRNGTGSWMIVEAKKRANEQQMKILRDNYGHGEQNNIDAVKEVYRDLRLREALLDFHHATFNRIQAKIDHNANKLPPAVFGYVLETMRQNSIDWCQRNVIL